MVIRRVVVICAVVIAVAASGLHAQGDVDELRETERARVRSLVVGDLDVARSLHAADFQLVTPTGSVVSRDSYLALIESGDVDYVEWEPEEIDVRVCDDAAVVRYQARLTILVRDQPDAPTGRFWHMDLYEKRDGRWQAVWSQATQIR